VGKKKLRNGPADMRQKQAIKNIDIFAPINHVNTVPAIQLIKKDL